MNLAMQEHISEEDTAIWYFPLEALLPASQRLALSRSLGILALIEQTAEDGPQMRAVQQFTPSELSVLLPLLAWYPDFAPYEHLMAHFESGSQQISEEQLERCRNKSNRALDGRGTSFEAIMRPVRNVISRTRLKLHVFDLDIVSMLETGYKLRRRPQRGSRP
jgi:hypothetical protein